MTIRDLTERLKNLLLQHADSNNERALLYRRLSTALDGMTVDICEALLDAITQFMTIETEFEERVNKILRGDRP